MGEILQSKQGDKEFRVVLTPHCHLVVQPNADAPRASFVLTIKTAVAKNLFQEYPLEGSNPTKRIKALGQRLQSPARFGSPEGRYWFLPGFLDMPDLYCDFLQLESLPFETIRNDFERIAVLDTPFAEALQSCFASFYSAVGLPVLDPKSFSHLVK